MGSRKNSEAERFLSTPSVGRATGLSRHYAGGGAISIHALRGEGDVRSKVRFVPVSKISIHALRGEGDESVLRVPRRRSYFYPRPPWGGRLRRACRPFPLLPYFYPRPPWGGRHNAGAASQGFTAISIHALRGEGDTTALTVPFGRKNFYPRPPWGGRPTGGCRAASHANFYPRPPWGGQPQICDAMTLTMQFLSTPSVGRATF